MRQLLLGRRGLAAAGMGLLAPPAVRAQGNWPERPVRLVVAYAPGGGTDLTTRAMAEGLTARLGQTFVVENRAGANGIVGSEAVARSAPDGYTFVTVTSTHVMNRHMVPNLPFDPMADFTPIALMARYPLVLMANTDAPFKDIPSLIAYAKTRPKGEIAQATSDAQSSYAANQFAKAAGIDLTEVPYRGSGAYLGDLTGGHLKLAWGSTATAMPLLTGGKVKVIAVTSPERSGFLPDSPTLVECGLPECTFIGWVGIFGPAKLPVEIARRFNRACAEVSATPSMQEKFRTMASDPAPMDLEALAATLRDDDARWAKAAKEGLLPRQ
ncbi:Bug family tripartite tricarboxylate transporter substrate binding protein [Belnapia rosea]|uniref:Tripartite-type tricarboxylate transporter, receptor component TctC n=1 Tax=Belnapia rosea TaxID=938405 RepID=A0A1G6ZNI2_9PROT|nr:tripartite tricarboxylate transporter substrate binding protein [Belnapia rosea]SDE03943.1 Tripartite-type tricarboxylate transporter, receptor component TctC [Belnapia rosea]